MSPQPRGGPPEAELALSRSVEDLLFGYRVLGCHFPDSRLIRGFPGITDWIVCGNGQLAFWELKTESGTLNPDQIRWRTELGAAGAVWSLKRPSDLAEGRIEAEIAAMAERNYP